MARPRRLRYKLMLGLGLVIGSVALLVGGTLYGIRAYNATVKTTERKMVELQLVNILIETLKGPAEHADPSPESLQSVGMQLGMLRETNTATIAEGLDPDGGDQESGLIAQLDAELEPPPGLQWSVPETGPESPRGASPRRFATTSTSAATTRTPAAAPSTSASPSSTTSRPASASRTGRSARASGSSASPPAGRRCSCSRCSTTSASGCSRRSASFRPACTASTAATSATRSRSRPATSLQELADEFNAMTARLAAIYDDLARQVNERSRQLVRSERMVSVGFLAAGVAHEINNPLASIPFCSEALERRLHEVLAALTVDRAADRAADAEVLTRYLKMIQQEAFRCKDITQKLLDFSRTGERKREPTDLAGLDSRRARGRPPPAELPRQEDRLRADRLHRRAGQCPGPQERDPEPRRQRPRQHGRRRASWRSRSARTAGYAELVFADTGCGMTPEVLENIFEPFFTRSRTGKGTGLGLFISHQIIDQHGGTIEAASAGPGRGSTFTVRVPLREVGGRRSQTRRRAGTGRAPFPGARVAA